MTDRKIVINRCSECPHRQHRGGFAKMSYVPQCGKNKQELPYAVNESYGVITASPTDAIPDWCPLEPNNPTGDTHENQDHQ